MGEYTLTMDASHKVKRQGGHARKWVKHIARDVDRDNGVEALHSNRRIVPERTQMNVTLVRGEDGVLVECTDSRQIDEAIERRLSTVKRPLRKDAVILRPLSVQLDPNWFDEHNPDWRENGLNEEATKHHADAVEWIEGRFGAENICGLSIHLDEDNPGIQFAFTPVTDDGRLSQAAFFTGPKSLSMMHTEFRKFMEARGYDVMHERSPRSREHLSSSDLAHEFDRVERNRATLDRQRSEFNDEYVEKTAKLDERASALDEREASVMSRESVVTTAEADLPRRRRVAQDEGRREGFAAGKMEGRIEARAQIEAELQQQRDAVSSYLAQAKKALDDAIEREQFAKASEEDALDMRARALDVLNRARDVRAEMEEAAGADGVVDVMLDAARGVNAPDIVLTSMTRARTAARNAAKAKKKSADEKMAELHADLNTRFGLSSTTPATTPTRSGVPGPEYP